jgi:hypothetical protein
MSDSSPPPERIPQLDNALYGVVSAERPIQANTTIETGITRPQTYMVKAALTFSGINWYRDGEKSAWQIYVTYKGFTYALSDYKNATWSLRTDSTEADALRFAQELKRKVRQAADVMDEVIQQYARNQIAAGEYFIYNNFWKIRSGYDYYRDQLAGQVKEREDRKASRPQPTGIQGWVDDYNEDMALNRRMAYTGYAMVGLYYSSLEVLFDVMFAFSTRTMDYKDFQQLTWAERFKMVLPPESSTEIASFYERLLLTKRSFRDKVFHGMGGDESLLVALPGAGLVPISSETLTTSIAYQHVTEGAEPAKQAAALFDEFDDWLDETLPYANHAAFARQATTIPLYSERLDRAREELKKSADEFQEWLNHESMYEDYMRDMM